MGGQCSHFQFVLLDEFVKIRNDGFFLFLFAKKYIP